MRNQQFLGQAAALTVSHKGYNLGYDFSKKKGLSLREGIAVLSKVMVLGSQGDVILLSVQLLLHVLFQCQFGECKAVTRGCTSI